MAAKNLEVIKGAIEQLAVAEKTTKALVAECAIDVLVYLHEHGQSQLLNSMLLILSPANKKAVHKFFSTFSGFIYDSEEASFTKKYKPEHDKAGAVKKDRYADSKIAFAEFVEQGGNFWTWWNAQDKPANKGEKAKLDLAKLTTTVKTAMKKASEEGVSNLAVFNAVISDVFTPDDILAFLGMAAKVDKVHLPADIKAAAE